MDTKENKAKKKPCKPGDLTREQLRCVLIKKKECNIRAREIVESLLEINITSNYLLKCLPEINQSHLEDIIEERAFDHMCGYPLCREPLLIEYIPRQKYRICMKTNKVYDITTRKKFCSNTCYQAAMFVKQQLLTSPLWFRKYEEIPKFTLMALDVPAGRLGEEVDVSLVKKLNVESEKKPFTSINDFTQASLNEMTSNDVNTATGDEHTKINKTEANVNKSDETTPSNNGPDLNSTKSQQLTEESKVQKEEISTHTEKTKAPPNNPLNIVGEIVEKPGTVIDPILRNIPVNKAVQTNKQLTSTKRDSTTDIIIEIEKSLAEWFTIDTMIFLFGEEKVKKMVADKGKCIKEYLSNCSNTSLYNSNTYDQYQALCKKLNLLELQDKKFDSNTLKGETKPLPDYTELHEEIQKMKLKVKVYFAGETEIEDSSSLEKDDSEIIKDANYFSFANYGQKVIRRRIVLRHLERMLPDILSSLGLSMLSLNSDVQLLVNSFELKANNIMFKPIQWMLIALVVIKSLSLSDKLLEYLLEQQTAFQHMQLLLLTLKQDVGYLDRLVSWLTDIDRFLDANDTQLTIE